MIFWLGVNIPERGGQLGRNMHDGSDISHRQLRVQAQSFGT